MKFSVLIPLYKNDTPDGFRACLDSIKNQTLAPDEVLIVVDGPISADLKQIAEESNHRIMYFSENRGLSYVLNDGIKSIENEIIFRMDADDVACPSRFQKQMNDFENDSNLVVVGGQVREFNSSLDNLKGYRIVPQNHEDILCFAKWRSPFNHPTVGFRKKVVESLGGYDVNAKFFEDYDLWVRILSAGYRTKNLPDVFCYMRVSDAFVRRRGGIRYAQHEWYLLRKMRHSKFINFFEFILLASIRLPVRLLPTGMLQMVYWLVARKNRLSSAVLSY